MSKNRTKDKDQGMYKNARDLIWKYINDNGLNQTKFMELFGICDSSQQGRIMSDDPEYSGNNFTLGEYVQIAEMLNISLNDLFGIPNPIGGITSPECPRDTCRMLIDLFDSDYYGFDFGIDINGNVCLTFPSTPPKALDPTSDAFNAPDDPLDALKELEYPFPSYMAGRELIYNFIVEWERDVGALRAKKISKEEYEERIKTRLNEIPRTHVMQLSHEQTVQRAFAAWAKDHPEEAEYYINLD